MKMPASCCSRGHSATLLSFYTDCAAPFFVAGSFDLDAGALDHLAPAREVLADQRAELFRRVAHRLHAQAREALLALPPGERLPTGRMHRGDGLGPHARGPRHAGVTISLRDAERRPRGRSRVPPRRP